MTTNPKGEKGSPKGKKGSPKGEKGSPKSYYMYENIRRGKGKLNLEKGVLSFKQ